MEAPSRAVAERQRPAGLIQIEQAKQLLAQANIFEAVDLRDKAAAIANYLKAQKDSYEAQCHAAEIKLRAERKAGELLREMEMPKGGRPKKNSTHDGCSLLDRLGIDDHQSSRWQEEATVDEDVFTDWLSEVKDKGDEVTQSGLLKLARGRSVAAAANTGEIEWYTPAEYIQMARQVMGSIDTDPASSDAANVVVEAETYYTEDNDGLQADRWCGNVWMNPPYAAGIVSKFTARLSAEINSGHCTQAIVLLNNATDTKWFADLVQLASAVCFKTGRIAFVNQEGEAIAGAAQGQVFLYFGRRVRSFCKVFSSIGWIAEVKHE